MANFIQSAIKKPGALHEDLGVPQGQKIPAAKLNAAANKGGKLGQRARFAQTLTRSPAQPLTLAVACELRSSQPEITHDGGRSQGCELSEDASTSETTSTEAIESRNSTTGESIRRGSANALAAAETISEGFEPAEVQHYTQADQQRGVEVLWLSRLWCQRRVRCAAIGLPLLA
jgi:hypothetical protein